MRTPKGASGVATNRALTVEPFDLQFYEASGIWLQNPELRELILAEPSQEDARRRWFDSLANRDDYWIWGVALEGKPVGCFGIKHVDRVHKTGEYWGYIGLSELWGKSIGGWILREAGRRAENAGIESLYLRVWSKNERALRLYRRAGFHNRFSYGELRVMACSIDKLLSSLAARTP